jgi:hypothetical protein
MSNSTRSKETTRDLLLSADLWVFCLQGPNVVYTVRMCAYHWLKSLRTAPQPGPSTLHVMLVVSDSSDEL